MTRYVFPMDLMRGSDAYLPLQNGESRTAERVKHVEEDLWWKPQDYGASTSRHADSCFATHLYAKLRCTRSVSSGRTLQRLCPKEAVSSIATSAHGPVLVTGTKPHTVHPNIAVDCWTNVNPTGFNAIDDFL
ncbi:hypothetical protein CPB83DRAFT_348782 [Crepidotus variabilis]|uniref:Uncharacterized protein n=1 Tax=Crepidotus variabilis TaxID=179855 RepID=A0A9P6BBJ8_9AGAR|nr:hypothetical protein CPB83DRAFT_348782 [Crepidotus variabilis]